MQIIESLAEAPGTIPISNGFFTSTEEDIKIIAGIIYGITGANYEDQLQTCLKDTYRFNRDNLHALEFVEPFNPRSTTTGFKILVSNLSELPMLLSHCIDSGSDFLDLFLWLAHFARPVHQLERIGLNVILNLGQIIESTLQINDHLYHGEYFWFGVGIGELAVFVTQDAVEHVEELTVAL